MVELNKRIMNKHMWVKVTPIARYVLSECETTQKLSNVIYLCDIETICNKYTDYINEKVLLEDYDEEHNVMRTWGDNN